MKADNYTKTQQLAQAIEFAGATHTGWDKESKAYKLVENVINAVKPLDIFASKVAATIEVTLGDYGRKVAKISSKQAWVLASAVIENKIEL